MKNLHIMILAAASCLSATAVTAQENIKAAFDKLINNPELAVKHTVSVRQQDKDDPSKLTGLCEVYNFQLMEKDKPLLEEIELAFETDKNNKELKFIAGRHSWEGDGTKDIERNGAYHMPYGEGGENYVYLNSPYFSRDKYKLLAVFDRTKEGKDYHYTYAMRWGDMNQEDEEDQESYVYRYMGKIVITYGTEKPLPTVTSYVISAKAEQERKTRLLPALLTSKMAALDKKDTLSQEDAIKLYQYFKTFRDWNEGAVDVDDLSISMFYFTSLFNKKNYSNEARAYLQGAQQILSRFINENLRTANIEKETKENFSSFFSKYLGAYCKENKIETADKLFSLIEKAVDNEWLVKEEKTAFAKEIDNALLNTNPTVSGYSLLESASKKLKRQ